jgi:hypothetical protein
MAIQFPDFQRISFDEANPWLVGAERGQKYMQSAIQFPQDIQAKILANQIAQVQAQYAQPMAEQGLLQSKQKTEWDPKIWGSEIGLRGAQTGLTNQQAKYYGQNIQSEMDARNAETNKINYLLQNPGFMGGDETKSVEALRQMGLLDKNYQPINQPQQEAGMGGFTPIPGNQQAMQMAAQQQQRAQQISQAVTQQQNSLGNSQLGQQSNNNFDVRGLVNSLLQKPQIDLNYKKAATESMNQNIKSKSFLGMPVAERGYFESQGRGFGLPAGAATKLGMQNYDLGDIAQMQGYDRNKPETWPLPKSAPTTATLTRLQQSNVATAGIQSLEPFITKNISPYVKQWNGISIDQLKDIVGGGNKEKLGKALAAGALSMDLNLLRGRQAGAPIGIEQLREAMDASQSRLNTPEILRDPEVFKIAQKYIRQELEKLNIAENRAAYNLHSNNMESTDRMQDMQDSLDEFGHMSDEEIRKYLKG